MTLLPRRPPPLRKPTAVGWPESKSANEVAVVRLPGCGSSNEILGVAEPSGRAAAEPSQGMRLIRARFPDLNKFQ